MSDTATNDNTLVVITDKKWKDFKYRNEVPAKVLEDRFEHLTEDDDCFLKYRDWWYHVTDFEFLRADHPLRKLGDWDGAHGDSFFSGVVIQIDKSYEHYRIGTFYS